MEKQLHCWNNSESCWDTSTHVFQCVHVSWVHLFNFHWTAFNLFTLSWADMLCFNICSISGVKVSILALETTILIEDLYFLLHLCEFWLIYNSSMNVPQTCILVYTKWYPVWIVWAYFQVSSGISPKYGKHFLFQLTSPCICCTFKIKAFFSSNS